MVFIGDEWDVYDVSMAGWWFFATPLKNDGVSSSVGMMKFPTEWKVKKIHGSKPPTRNFLGYGEIPKNSW